MNLYGLEVKVMETAEQFSFTPRLNDDDYPLSNIKKAIIRLTQPSGNYKELTINNPTESILLSYQDFYEITEGTYILTLRVTDTSDNLIIFPNLNSIVADVTDSSISIEGNVLSAAMVNDIYNKMKSEVIQGAKGDAATVSVGTVDTLNPDEEATVTNSGNSNNAVFNFGIPKGDKGDTGEQGKQGPQGHVGLTPLTFVGYADDNSGNGFNTNPQSSSKYIGVYQTSMYSLVTGKAFNQYVNASDGTFSDSSNDIRTDYIEVKPNTEYTVNFNPYATGVEIEHSNLVYYDENKQYISKEPTIETNVVSLNNGSSTTITTPENCKYVVISTHCDQTNSINSTIQLAEGYVDVNSEDSSRYKWSLMQGPQGDTGSAATLSVGNVTTFNPYVCFDSAGKDYFKGWVSNSATENAGTDDITTDYFQVYANDIYTVSLPATLPPLSDSHKLRICWFDTDKNFIKQDEIVGGISYPYNFTKIAPKDGYARVCLWVGGNSNMTGDNQHITVTDNGHPFLDNSGNSSNAIFDFHLSAGVPGLQGPQGIQGEQGPQGTMGDYGLFTGWLDLKPYMDFDNVWNTADNSTYCVYAVTHFNGQNILWIRIHAKLRDASVATKFGTTLFTIPPDVVSQYGNGEWSQYNSMYETCGTPCIYNYQKSSEKVVTQGYVPMISNGNTSSAPSGTVKDCNLEAWFML